MRSLNASDVITVWEVGQRLHPLERTITLLSFASPDQSPQQLARLSMGARDRRLFALRQRTIGSQLNSVITCPHCGDRLEFTLHLSDLGVDEREDKFSEDLIEDLIEDLAEKKTIQIGTFEFQFRLPNSADLALLTVSQTPEAAYRSLIQSCILQVSQAGISVSWETLPSEILAQFAQQISDADPQAEILLDLICPHCTYRWQTVFDIASFFWAELDALAKRLLQEVHVLAQAYGWREAEILSMTATRRQFYLEMVR